MIGGLAADDNWGWNKFDKCYVWYTYYDVDGTETDSELCRLENRDTVVLTPDEVPISKMSFELMNDPTKQIIRQLLLAEAKITIANIRGYASRSSKDSSR